MPVSASTCPLVRRRWGEGEGEEEEDPLIASISEDGKTGLVLLSRRGCLKRERTTCFGRVPHVRVCVMTDHDADKLQNVT